MTGLITAENKNIAKVITLLEVSSIFPDPSKPKPAIYKNDLIELAVSIKENGILKPLLVRKISNRYELIDGEKRLRAAKLCKMSMVPCVIQEYKDENSSINYILNSIKYHELDMFDEAAAISDLIKYYGLTQAEAASKLGKAQSTIANKLRLLRLTESEKDLIIKHSLTERHARTLLRIASPENRLEILKKIIELDLNVERTELYIDEYIGSQKEKNAYKKRIRNFQNVNIFINTINKAVHQMQATGINALYHKYQNEDFIEYSVRIPISK